MMSKSKKALKEEKVKALVINLVEGLSASDMLFITSCCNELYNELSKTKVGKEQYDVMLTFSCGMFLCGKHQKNSINNTKIKATRKRKKSKRASAAIEIEA